MKTLLICALLTATAYAQAIPHLEQRGEATQLIVDGKPFLALSGELANTAPSNPEYMRKIFPILAKQVHLNTLLIPLAWAWVEPEEGKYDFSIADAESPAPTSTTSASSGCGSAVGRTGSRTSRRHG